MQPDLCFVIVTIVTIYIIIVMEVLVAQPDLCRSSGETPSGAPAMAVIGIIMNHDRQQKHRSHQNHDRHQNCDHNHQRHYHHHQSHYHNQNYDCYHL